MLQTMLGSSWLHSSNHHALTPPASLTHIQSRPPTREGFCWARGPGKEESPSTTSQDSLPAGDVPPFTLPLQNEASGSVAVEQRNAVAWCQPPCPPHTHAHTVWGVSGCSNGDDAVCLLGQLLSRPTVYL